jgi:hypothetical protein
MVGRIICSAYKRGVDCLNIIGGWDAVRLAFEHSSFIRTGVIVSGPYTPPYFLRPPTRLTTKSQAAGAFAFLLIHSPSPIRHAFYETFLHLHIVIVATSFIFLWTHLNGKPAQQFLLGAIVLWTIEVPYYLPSHEGYQQEKTAMY